ncbi:MAG: LysE family translocator [Gammaproteobacteria bacterium]|nr:LysE family translocator [Gammaproteobacteria bacterium]MBU1554812.1 LysE family translocator [Gammaproteobacteria bacterium]MBU2070268.1 LysE family translocator [Gammaproteobacteria bacterium]MBU2183971.1 LysE family translocator [Gammaproteobacteria bacterium]MBU2206775.1 LysE family translocator [Gammaproteobacteria bacterium]
MTLSLISSMALFALAASLSPGPVNLVSVSSGARYGAAAGIHFISGATLGFIGLFLIIGFGLQHIISVLPWLTTALQWLGISFLLYLSYRLFTDNGGANGQTDSKAPNFITGAVMQWLNPKAWLAAVAGIVAYIPQANTDHVLIFAAVYLPVCWLSLAVWLWAGIALGRRVQSAAGMRLLNKTLATLLAFSCILLLL